MGARRWAWRATPLYILVLALLGISSRISAQDAALRVDPTQTLGAISPTIYGANYGPWSGISVETTPYAVDLSLKFLRFPGGNWGDQNDLRPFDIDMYIMLAKQMGAQPSICARLKGGTPEKAAELVRYVNIEKQYGVKYWCIGNEPDLYEGYTVEQANTEWREMALAMEAVDPTILFLGPEVSQYPPTEAGDEYNNVRREQVRSFLEMNGDLVDIVTIHRYPFPRSMNSSTTADELMANPAEWDVIIPNLRAVVKEATGRDLPVGVMEVNSHWSDSTGGVATNDSFLNSIWWADVLGRLINQKVEYAAFFLLRNTTNPASYGLIDKYEPRPTYYIYQLYKNFGTELVSSETDNDFITITAALTDDGALTLMVVNRNAEAQSVSLEIVGDGFSGDAETWLVDETHHAEAMDATPFSSTTTLELPAYSVTLYRLAAAD
jgi:hypothetical protein